MPVLYCVVPVLRMNLVRACIHVRARRTAPDHSLLGWFLTHCGFAGEVPRARTYMRARTKFVLNTGTTHLSAGVQVIKNKTHHPKPKKKASTASTKHPS